MVTRNINRPAYALALLFGIVAIADAANALMAMQTTRNGGNAGWVIDLAAAAISAAFATVLLMRPHVYVFGAAAVWALVAFVVNFALRQPDGVDQIATYRMVIYFLVFVGSVVLVIADLWERSEPQRAARGMGPRPWPPLYGQPGASAPYPPSSMGPMAVPMAPAAPAPAAPAGPPVQMPGPGPAPGPMAPGTVAPAPAYVPPPGLPERQSSSEPPESPDAQ